MSAIEALVVSVSFILIVIVTRVIISLIGFGSIGISLGVASGVSIAIAVDLAKKRTDDPPRYFKIQIGALLIISTLLVHGVLVILPGNLAASLNGLLISALLIIVMSPFICSSLWRSVNSDQ